MHGPARKHIGARREVRASRPLHHQQLPWIARAYEQHGRRRSRRDRRTFVDRGGREHLTRIVEMDLGIAGKVALVTAATRGIGLAIAQALAREGARVSVVARTEADVRRVAESIGGAGVAADVLTEAGCKRAVAATEEALGPIDILVKSLAREVAARGVTVNGIAPGSILWEGGGWHRRQQADPEGIAEFVRHEMPLGRFGTVDEVAGVVAFVCSKQASLLNGASIA